MSDVKVYLHTLPLGGFIRAVDERDYLQACKERDRLRVLLRATIKQCDSDFCKFPKCDCHDEARVALKAAGIKE